MFFLGVCLNALNGQKMDRSDIRGDVWGDKKGNGKTKRFDRGDVWSDILAVKIVKIIKRRKFVKYIIFA